MSIIVCTYNRLDLLKCFVDSVLPQLPSPYPIEILIVDNNSRDGTAPYARRLAEEHSDFSYFRETKQGLSNARNGGAAAAKYEFLLYCDDDSFLPLDFLEAISRAVAENEPDLFGGPCLPHYVDPRPAWFPEWLEVRKKADASGFSKSVTLSGSNFGIRRSILWRLGGFNPEFGMIGNRPGMLEERLVMESYRRTTPADQQKVYYCVEAFVYHHTPASRMRFSFQVRRIYQANFGFARYMLGQGIRAPALFRDRTAIRFARETTRYLSLFPSLWRKRKTEPDRAMSEFIRVVYRAADYHGALAALGDARRAKKREKKKRPPRAREQRPLHVVALILDPPETDERHRRRLHAILEHLQTVCVLTIRYLDGMTGEEIHALNWHLDANNFDVILTDAPNAAFALRDLRASAPHIQILLWARDAKTFMPVQQPWRLLRHPIRLQRRIRRLRKTARNVDQVIWSISRRAWLPALLLNPRDWIVVPNAPKGTVTAPPICVKAWRKVLDKAAVWAPVRKFSDAILPAAQHRSPVFVGLFVNSQDRDVGHGLAHLTKTLGAPADWECRRVTGLDGDQIRDIVIDMDPQKIGVIVTDSPDVVLALRGLQEEAPHLTIALWARNTKQFPALFRPWAFWRNPLKLKRLFSRARLAASLADQVVWTTHGERLARFVLGDANWTLPAAPHRPPVFVGLFINPEDGDPNQVLARLTETLGAATELGSRSVAGLDGAQVRDIVADLDPQKIGVIVTDSPDVILALHRLQAEAPHLQLVLWARATKQFPALFRPWAFWRNPLELKRFLSRLRLAASLADQIVWTIRGKDIARILLGSANWMTLPSPNDALGSSKCNRPLKRR